ncbi:hypothetical protein SteCoe_7773 [Stentor coeruleus]|uniref:Uncharacterized protein n=1 Tax=Stentor coeruleus TaxID=5963 RepID=A0A1R2CLU4_9CILI|nr:hypothetical protein SteCoe_7773 [Stentor coeruleus]
MECKCFVTGCQKPVSFKWDLGSSVTYSCNLHKILENNLIANNSPHETSIIPKSSTKLSHNHIYFIQALIIIAFSVLLYYIANQQKASLQNLSQKINILSNQIDNSDLFYSEIKEIREIIENKDKTNNKKNSLVLRDNNPEFNIFSPSNYAKSLSKRQSQIVLTQSDLPLDVKIQIIRKNFGLYLEDVQSEILTISFTNKISILVGSMDGIISTYNFKNHEAKAVYKGKARVYAIVPSKDNITAIVTGDININILSLNKMMYLKTFPGHDHLILTTIVSDDDSLFITGSCDKIIKIWDHFTLEFLYELKGHTGDIWSLSLSDDNILLVSGSEDQQVILWNLTSQEIIKKFSQNSPIYAVALTKDNKKIISGGSDNKIYIWDIDTGNYNILTHNGMVKSLVLAKNDNDIIVCGGNYVSIWNLYRLNMIYEFKHIDVLVSVAVSSDMKFIVCGDVANRIWVWDYGSGELLWVFGGFIGNIQDVLLTNDLKYLVLAEKGLVRIWDMKKVRQIAVFISAFQLNAWEIVDLKAFEKYLA